MPLSWKRLAIVGASVGIGIALTLGLVRVALAWHSQQAHSALAKAPAKTLPAQVLRFVDATGRDVASLDFIPGWHQLAVFDAGGEPFANFVDVESDGYRELTLYSANGHDFLQSATFGDAPSFTVNRQDGARKFIQSKTTPTPPESGGDWVKHVVKETSGWAFRRFVPEKPLWTLDGVIPSQDVELFDKDGAVFAVLGLGRGGEPTLALFGKGGTLQLAWTYSYIGRYPELHLFDDKDIRVSIETSPPSSVRLILSEPDGEYVLDPNTYEELPKGRGPLNGELPWLRHRIGPPKLPIMLLDQRNNVLWRAP
jgi:hypothetical protein